MDQITTITEEIRKDTIEWFGPNFVNDLGYLGLALSGETGEFANIVKKVMRGTLTYDEALKHMREEIIDVFIYVLMLAKALDMDIQAEYQAKREFNHVRFGK